MKKFSITILAVFYLMISSGMIVNLHYCMNRFTSADFNLSSTAGKCDQCGMHKTASKGCCHDEVKLVKIQDDQQKASFATTELSALTIPVVIPSQFIATSFYNGDHVNHYKVLSPPMLNQPDARVLNCLFRI